MQAALLLALACLAVALAAEGPTSPSLRGGRTPSELAENSTAALLGAAEGRGSAPSGVAESSTAATLGTAEERGSAPSGMAENSTAALLGAAEERGSAPSEEAKNSIAATLGAAEELTSDLALAGVNASGLEAAAAAASVPAEASVLEASVAEDTVELLVSGGNHSEGAVDAMLSSSSGWYQGGDKVWGSGSGIESINSGNVGYYNQGMYAARAGCGDAGCALIVNPPGHRSVEVFHIHMVHYQSYGRDLKSKLESRACGSSGWHGGGLPCGGKAAFFSGFPGVFSAAMSGGNIHSASVIAWPASCGGRGTIVEIAYGCSIEHQIRGDYNPALR